MKPFLGFSDKERLFFSVLNDRSALEASIKERSLVLLNELEYLLTIDNHAVDIEWSMEMDEDYFRFPIEAGDGGAVMVYVRFDYERGFYVCVSSAESNQSGRLALVDALSNSRNSLGHLGMTVDETGSANLSDPGMAVDAVNENAIARWRADATPLAVGRFFDPAEKLFGGRAALQELHEAVRALVAFFRKQ